MRLRKEDEFKANLGYKMRCSLKDQNQNKQALRRQREASVSSMEFATQPGKMARDTQRNPV